MSMNWGGALVLAVAGFGAAGVATAQAQPALPADIAHDRAPVVVDGRTLAEVRGVAGKPAAERAAEIAARVVDAARDPAVQPEQLHIVETELASQIQAGDRFIMAVLDADALVEQMDRRALAEVELRLIRDALVRYRAERTPERLREGIRNASLATLAFVVALVAVLWVARRIAAAATARLKPRVLAMRVHAIQLAPGEHVWTSITTAARGLRLLVVALLVYLYAQYALTQFPATRVAGERLASYLLDPLHRMGRAFVTELPSLMFLLVLFFVVRVILRMLGLYFAAIGSGAIHVAGFERIWAGPTYRLVRLGVIAFALVVAYPYIPGSESEAFKGLSIFAGVLISIGSSSFIANYMAGYTLIYRKLFSVGDRVRIGDVVGEVLEMKVQVTRMRSFKNEEVIVPNSAILQSTVVNYSTLAASRGLILHTSVGIGYEVPWRQVEGMLLAAAERTRGVLKDPPPFVLHKSLGDFAVQYEVNAYVDTADDLAGRYTELHAHILDVFNEHGVQIMTPAYEGDTAEPMVVPRERWFEAPSRRRPDGA
jgi:small-conductance mechanosensitive channel